MGLRQTFELRPFHKKDRKEVLAICDMIDEEMAEECQSALKDDEAVRLTVERVEGDDRIISGLTGWRFIEGTSGSAWLGWTCLDTAYASEKDFLSVLTQLLDMAKQANIRKLFVSETNDPPAHKKRYFRAMFDAMAQLGFEVELTHEAYYTEREGVQFLGKAIETAGGLEAGAEMLMPIESGVHFTDSDEISECDDAYYLDWTDTDGDYGDLPAGSNSAEWLEKIEKWEGRCVFVSGPSNHDGLRQIALAAGFEETGALKDFYGPEVHEVHYRFNLEG